MDGRSSRPVFTEKRHGSLYTRGLLLRFHEIAILSQISTSASLDTRNLDQKSLWKRGLLFPSRINRLDQFPFISIHRNCAIHFLENRRKKKKEKESEGKSRKWENWGRKD